MKVLVTLRQAIRFHIVTPSPPMRALGFYAEEVAKAGTDTTRVFLATVVVAHPDDAWADGVAFPEVRTVEVDRANILATTEVP